jgi:hypothetical protein
MKKTTTILAALAASVLTVTAGTPAPVPAPVCVAPADPCAGPISYSNAELLYAYTDFDNSSDNGDGAILRLEYSAMDNFYVAVSGEYHEAGIIDMWSISGGVGGYVPLTENIHLAADGGVLWVNYDVDSDPFSSANNGWSDDDVGWYVRPHIRAKWGCLEVHAGAQYSDVSDFDIDEWAVFANLYYQVAPGWDLTAGVAHSSERTTVTGGARYRF